MNKKQTIKSIASFLAAVLLVTAVSFGLLNWRLRGVLADPDPLKKLQLVLSLGQATLQGLVVRPTGALVPASGNASPFKVVLEMNRQTSLDAPLTFVPQAFVALPTVTQIGSGLSNSVSCVLTNANTAAECTISPSPGPNWGNTGSMVFRFVGTTTDGYVSTISLPLTVL